MRRALWAFVALLALSSVSCAGGTDDASGNAGTAGAAGTTAGGAGVSGVGGATTCGNGTVDSAMGEQCEPGGAVPNCQALGMGSGMVVCNNACRLMMMCTGATPTGGSGSFGNGGSQG